MPFKKFIQIGRVVYVNYGPEQGKLCAIVDIIDQNRALVDGPCSGVKRQEMPFKAMEITDFLLKIYPSAPVTKVKEAWEKSDVAKQWAETAFAKKMDRNSKRAQLSDFDRYKLSVLKRKTNKMIRTEMGRLRNAARKAAKSKK